MAIEFTNKPIKWENEGTAPSEDLKTNGFQAGYKPPAAVFNNQWHITGECIEELQTKLSNTDDKKVDKFEGKSLIDENVANNIEYYKDSSGYPHIQISPAGSSNMQSCVFSYDGLKITETTHPSHSVILSTSEGLIIEGEMDVSLRKGSSGGTLHKLSEKLDVADFNANAVTKDSSTNMGINGELIFPHPLGGSANYVKIDGDGGVVAHYENSDDISADIRPDITLIQGSKTHKLSEKANVSDLPIKSLAGRTVKVLTYEMGEPPTEVTAKAGATIIGDLRQTTFSNSTYVSLNEGNVASGTYAVAIGSRNTARSDNSVAIGQATYVAGTNAVALGFNGQATGSASIVVGGRSGKATGTYSATLGGGFNNASGSHSVAMGGMRNVASGEYSVAMGTENTALALQTKIGQYAKDGAAGASSSTDGDAFIIGNGTGTTARSNAFRVTYDGKAYGLSAYGSSGADYAELFEWKDGNPDNEDRRGMFVTLDGEKIRLATADDDYILGVVSANPCIEGDVYSDDWQGKYLTDVFGQRLTQTVHIHARYEEQEVTDPETGETTTENVLIEEEHDAVQWVLNPDFDPEQEYVSREDRKEWSPIGLMGKLVVVDDGTCEVNGYCKAGVNGIATKADDGYRVMARIDDTHIRVLVR